MSLIFIISESLGPPIIFYLWRKLFYLLCAKVTRMISKYGINTPHSKKLSDKLLELYFRLQITFCEFVENVAIIFYVLQIQENIMVTIRVSLDFPIVFDRMRKTIFQFYRKVTWKIPIFLRTPPNCPSVKKYCPQSNQNIFAKKSPMNFIQSASEPFIDQLQNTL